jgi:carboxypeptidase C (cathepsin A)
MPRHARQAKRLAQGEYLTLAGGHMFPLERPQATAELLHSLLQRWDQRARQESP